VMSSSSNLDPILDCLELQTKRWSRNPYAMAGCADYCQSSDSVASMLVFERRALGPVVAGRRLVAWHHPMCPRWAYCGPSTTRRLWQGIQTTP
jgi:hypothetical protein